jgi:hypothetical protein
MGLEEIKQLLKENDEYLKKDLVHMIHLQNKEYSESYNNLYSKIMDMNDESEKEKHDKIYAKTLEDIIPYTYIGNDKSDEALCISCDEPLNIRIIIHTTSEHYKQYRDKIPYSLNGIPIFVNKMSIIEEEWI